MTIEEIKRISLLDFMFSIGYSKIKSSGNKYWFLSPLHKETKASFKVDVNTNLWYDFGLNKGGNIINLVQLLNPELSMHNITGHNTKCGMSKMWGELHETAYTSVIDEC